MKISLKTLFYFYCLSTLVIESTTLSSLGTDRLFEDGCRRASVNKRLSQILQTKFFVHQLNALPCFINICLPTPFL